MKNFFKVLGFFCITLFFLLNLNVVAYSAFFKFNNLEEARKIYPKNQKKAKELIFEVINYYQNKKAKYPWVAYAYGDLSYFFQIEKNFLESLNFNKKACEEFEKFYISEKNKKRVVERDNNLSTCYYLLASAYSKIKKYKDALSINIKNQNIYKNYQNFAIEKKNDYHTVIFQLASIHGNLEDFKKQRDAYLEYLKILKKNKKENEIKYVEALTYISTTYLKLGDNLNSKKFQIQAINNLEKYHPNLFLKKANVFYSIALSERNLNNDNSYNFYAKAKKELDKINFENLKTGSDDYKSYVSTFFPVLTGLATLKYNQTNDLSILEENFKELENFNKKLNILYQSTDGYRQLEEMYNKIDQHQKAADINLKSLELIDRQIEEVGKINLEFKEYALSGFVSDKRSLLFDRAYILLNLNKIEEAQKIKNDLKKFEKSSNDRFELIYKSDLKVLEGRIFNQKEDYNNAIKNYLLGLEYLKKIPNLSANYKKTILNNLALAYRNLGKYQLAQKTFENFILISDGKYKFSDIRTLNNFALVTNDLGSFCSISQKAYNIYDNVDPRLKKTQQYVNTLTNLGQCFVFQNKLNEAREIYSKGIEFVLSKIEDKNFYFDNFIYDYSNLLYKLKENNKSANYLLIFTDSITRNFSASNPRLLLAYKNLSSHYGMNKNDKYQIEYGLKALDIILSEIDKRNNSLDFNLNKYLDNHRMFLTNFMFSIIRLSNDNIELLNSYKDRDFIDVFFIIQQILKINKLNTSIQRAVAIDMAKNKSIYDDIKKITYLNKSREKILLTSPSDINFNKLDYLKLEKIENEIKILNEKIQRNYPDFKKNYASQFASTALIGFNLKDDEAYIELTHSKYFLYITVLTNKNRIVKYLKIPNTEIANLIKKVRSSVQLENNNIKPFDYDSAKKLYKNIFSPIEENLKNINKLYIIPEKQTLSLPFELLVYSEFYKEKFLIEKYSISIMPSAAAFIGINNSKTFSSNQNFAGFGNPKIKKINSDVKINEKYTKEFSSYFTRGGKVKIEYLRFLPELPETEIELNLIKKKFGGNSKIFTRENFTEANIKNFNFSEYKVINFASHALVVGEIDGLAEPAILTTVPEKIDGDKDGLLTTSEIAKLKINTDLVILSACNTASSDGKPSSDGLSGLANAFFYSGSKSLLVTHWSVISDTTVSFISNLFDYIKNSNGDVSKALQKSKIEMIGSKDYSHPIFWAPYVLVGRSQI